MPPVRILGSTSNHLDLDDEPGRDVADEDGRSGGGPFRNLLGRLGRGSDEDRDMEGNADIDDINGDDDTEAVDANTKESSDSDENSPIQRVKSEGVADVRPVGPDADAMTPPRESAGNGEATEVGVPDGGQPDGSDSAGAASEEDDPDTPTQASPEESSSDLESAPKEDGDDNKKGGLDLSLNPNPPKDGV